MADTFGLRLLMERKRLGLNQAEFAQIGGIGRTSQIKYENGSRSPDCVYLQNLAGHGIDTYYLITGQRLPIPAAIVTDNGPGYSSQLTAERLERLTTTVRYLRDTLTTAQAALERAEGWLVPNDNNLQALADSNNSET